MSVPHSGNPEHESELLEKFRQQLAGEKSRAWPEGRVSGDDDGEVVFKVAGDTEKQLVILDFGKPVTWLGMPPQHAVELAQLLIRHARSTSSDPLSIVLH